MDYFKVAIIKMNGKCDMVGTDVEELHSQCLLDYANNNYDAKIFKKLNFRHRAEVISYFLTQLGDIVFLNTTKDVEKYGYIGVLMLPRNITNVQRDSLDQFLEKISMFNICLVTDLYLDGGILQANELYPISDETPSSLVQRYFNSKRM